MWFVFYPETHLDLSFYLQFQAKEYLESCEPDILMACESLCREYFHFDYECFVKWLGEAPKVGYLQNFCETSMESILYLTASDANLETK